MKLKLVKKLAAFLCTILALTMLLPAALAADAPVTVSLSPVSGQKGETVTVDVKISDKSNVGNASMTVNYDPAKLEFVSAKGGDFGGMAAVGLAKGADGKEIPGQVSVAFIMSDILQKEAVIAQITFKILDDSGSIPLTLTMKEIVAYTPDGMETDLMDTVKTENASVSIKAPTTAPATTKPTTTAPDTTKPAATQPEGTKPMSTQPVTEKPAESTAAETAVNPGTGEGTAFAACSALAAAAGAAVVLTRRKKSA